MVSEPATCAELLTGAPAMAVTRNGAPRGPMTFGLWEPPLTSTRGVAGAPVRLELEVVVLEVGDRVGHVRLARQEGLLPDHPPAPADARSALDLRRRGPDHPAVDLRSARIGSQVVVAVLVGACGAPGEKDEEGREHYGAQLHGNLQPVLGFRPRIAQYASR